jgi:uncharacterized protein YecE (DUF72 family)
MTTSIGSLYVGASGFSYPSWKGGFYPPVLPAKDFLRHYAGRLPSVELNSTFYNLPSEAAVEGWAEATPPGFRFAVKMNRRISQFGTLALAGEFCERMKGLGERLGPIRVLVTRARDEGWLSLLVDSLDPGLSYAFEFRHPSWEGAGSELTRVGSPEAPGSFRYLRFRDPPYSEDGLARAAREIRELLDSGVDVYAYFRHEDLPTAPLYAERLQALVDAGGDG